MVRAESGGRWIARGLVLSVVGGLAGLFPVLGEAPLSSQDGFPVPGLGQAQYDEEVISQMSARVALGFRSDAAFVGDLVTRQRFGDPSLELVSGFAYTAPEAAELRIRSDLLRDALEIGSYGSSQADSYAGVYIDQPHGTVVARFTQDVDLHAARLKASIVLPDRLRVADARWTVAQLAEASQAAIDAGSALAGFGARLVGVALSPEANTVLVVVSEITPQASAYFGAHFPAGLIDLQVGSPPRADS